MNALAPFGKTGQWLLDPADIDINTTGTTAHNETFGSDNFSGTSTIMATTIDTALQSRRSFAAGQQRHRDQRSCHHQQRGHRRPHLHHGGRPLHHFQPAHQLWRRQHRPDRRQPRWRRQPNLSPVVSRLHFRHRRHHRLATQHDLESRWHRRKCNRLVEQPAAARQCHQRLCQDAQCQRLSDQHRHGRHRQQQQYQRRGCRHGNRQSGGCQHSAKRADPRQRPECNRNRSGRHDFARRRQ